MRQHPIRKSENEDEQEDHVEFLPGDVSQLTDSSPLADLTLDMIQNAQKLVTLLEEASPGEVRAVGFRLKRFLRILHELPAVIPEGVKIGFGPDGIAKSMEDLPKWLQPEI